MNTMVQLALLYHFKYFFFNPIEGTMSELRLVTMQEFLIA